MQIGVSMVSLGLGVLVPGPGLSLNVRWPLGIPYWRKQQGRWTLLWMKPYLLSLLLLRLLLPYVKQIDLLHEVRTHYLSFERRATSVFCHHPSARFCALLFLVTVSLSLSLFSFARRGHVHLPDWTA